MRKILEYTLISIDGVFEDPQAMGFMSYRDEAYLRDGLGVLLSSEAMLMGRMTYQLFSRAWPGRNHPWAARINDIPKYVFSRQLQEVPWGNATLVGADLVGELSRLKKSEGGPLLVFGHGLIGESLLREDLLDVLELSIHPLIVGGGQTLFRAGQRANLTLASTKAFSKIVKLTYERQIPNAAVRQP